MEAILLWMHFETVMCMSCVPEVLHGVVCVVNVALALLRMCLMRSIFNICYQSYDHKKLRSTWVTVSRCRGEAHFPFRCAPGSVVMRRHQVRF